MTRTVDWDVIILGAGASGLMCATVAGRRGRRVLVLDHARRVGEKIHVSGGGRCNFTNLHADASHYISSLPAFVTPALSAFTPHDILQWMKRHGIGYHEKKLGQMFCDQSSVAVVDMLFKGCQRAGVRVGLHEEIVRINTDNDRYVVTTRHGAWSTHALVVALGGRSMPKLGATPLGYAIARQFGVPVVAPRPGLTPLSCSGEMRTLCQALTGVSLPVTVQHGEVSFTDDLLFTHRGMSGPVVLQISSFWRTGEEICLDLTPDIDLLARLKQSKEQEPTVALRTLLSRFLPRRLALLWLERFGRDGRMGEISDRDLRLLADSLRHWVITPSGTGGYERAEVTVGGVDTRAMDPVTLACRTHPGLFFIGEVLDVTGWLGGYNLQWAWSSGHAAGLAV